MSQEKTSVPKSSIPESNSMDPSARLKKLVDMSHSISVDKNIPVSRYFNSGRELIKQAAVCEQSGDIEKAFVLYLRYMTLFIEKIIHHPEYNKADKAEKALVKNECNHVFDLAESLKARIKEKYQKEYEEHLIEQKNNSNKQQQLNNATKSSLPLFGEEDEELFKF